MAVTTVVNREYTWEVTLADFLILISTTNRFHGDELASLKRVFADSPNDVSIKIDDYKNISVVWKERVDE